MCSKRQMSWTKIYEGNLWICLSLALKKTLLTSWDTTDRRKWLEWCKNPKKKWCVVEIFVEWNKNQNRFTDLSNFNTHDFKNPTIKCAKFLYFSLYTSFPFPSSGRLFQNKNILLVNNLFKLPDKMYLVLTYVYLPMCQHCK